MAGETNTYTSNMSTNIFEDVEDTIYKISPHKHPFMSAIGKGKADSTKVEWLEDTDRAAGANAHKEVEVATFSEASAASRLYNYTQIFRESFAVSNTLRQVATIGRSDEVQRLTKKALMAVADDMEYAFTNNTTAAAGDASTARTTKGAAGFIDTNKFVPSGYGSTTANLFTEAVFLDLMQKCWNAGGEPSMLLVPGSQSQKIASWTQAQRQTVNTNADSRTLVMEVVLLQTPFGSVKVELSRFIAEDDQSGTKYDSVFILDPKRFQSATLQSVKLEELARTGNFTPYMVEGQAALKCYNEKANAKATKLTRV